MYKACAYILPVPNATGNVDLPYPWSWLMGAFDLSVLKYEAFDGIAV